MNHGKPQANSSEPGRFAFDKIDWIIHEKRRLGILTSLLSHPSGLLFNDLKQLCNLTDGNLSSHLETLQKAGLIEVWKRFSGKRPQTLCRITDIGKEKFLEYIGILETIIADAVPLCDREKISDEYWKALPRPESI